MLARWAAAVPPGALVDDAVRLVVERLGSGDPEELASQVMAEATGSAATGGRGRRTDAVAGIRAGGRVGRAPPGQAP